VIDGALALVSSGFLPLGLSLFMWSCAAGVIGVPILFYLNTIHAIHALGKLMCSLVY
jgi:di/tricarboxylate transporter